MKLIFSTVPGARGRVRALGLLATLLTPSFSALVCAQPPASRPPATRPPGGRRSASPPPAGLLAALKAIRAGYALTAEGHLIRDDFEAAFAITDPGFSEISPGGVRLARKQWIQSVMKLVPDLGPNGVITNTIGSVHWLGGAAVVDITQDLTTTFHHRGQTGHFEEISHNRDTWMLIQGDWKIHVSQSLGERDYVDGKLVYDLK